MLLGRARTVKSAHLAVSHAHYRTARITRNTNTNAPNKIVLVQLSHWRSGRVGILFFPAPPRWVKSNQLETKFSRLNRHRLVTSAAESNYPFRIISDTRGKRTDGRRFPAKMMIFLGTQHSDKPNERDRVSRTKPSQCSSSSRKLVEWCQCCQIDER